MICINHLYIQYLSISDTSTETSQKFRLSISMQSRNNAVALYLSKSL